MNGAASRRTSNCTTSVYDDSHGSVITQDKTVGFRLDVNVIDLAVAVVIGAAFGLWFPYSLPTSSLTFIAAIVGKPDFSALVATVHR